jgi:hypothetical protein
VLDIDRRQIAAVRSLSVTPSASTESEPARKTPRPAHRTPVCGAEAFSEAMRLMRRLSRSVAFGDGSEAESLERRIDRLLATETDHAAAVPV